MRLRGPKCSACGRRQVVPAPMSVAVVPTVVFVIVGWNAMNALPVATANVIAICVGMMIGIGAPRAYRRWWFWWHPQRCQGGGLLEPGPSHG